MIELTFLSELMLVRQVNQKSVFSRTDSGDWFISTNFEKYEKHRKVKEERIKTLEESLTNMSKWVDSLSSQVDKQEQYSRHNCLLLHDIPENKNETIDDLCLTTINEHLDLAITEVDIERTHRIGKPRDVDQKPRPIVKFVRYNDRKNVFNRKKKLKGKNISITESLTATRMKKLKEAREIHSFKNVWTSDGKILFRDGSGNINLFYD